MNNKYFKVLIISLLLSVLLGVMACATGGGPVAPTGPSTPSGGYPTPSDPEFWKLWESSHGLG
jgi:hypothetical protein